jgi:serine/threonine protein kinase
VALKILEKRQFENNEMVMQTLINEIRAHWILEQCEGVLKTFAIYDNADYIVLALEYQAKGSLMQSLEKYKRFTEVEVRVIMEQLLLVLDFF